MTSKPEGIERLHVAIPLGELKAIEEFRFRHRTPTRSAAVRELLRRGLAACESERANEVAKKNTKMR
jgi:metal-responsive CopG/Arc/MetJ family transcriptional regulator